MNDLIDARERKMPILHHTRRLFLDVVGGAVSGIVSGLVVVLVLLLFAEQLSDRAAEISPTCDDPRGLSPIKRTDMTVTTDGRASNAVNGKVSNAIDGDGATMWRPTGTTTTEEASKVPVFTDAAAATLLVSLNKPRNVALVCATNGQTRGYEYYLNFARIRSVEVWSDDGSRDTTSLRLMGADQFQSLQVIGRDLGTTDSVRIRLVEATAGQSIRAFDPDICHTAGPDGDLVPDPTDRDKTPVQRADMRGCIVEASTEVGVSEVAVWEDSD